MAPQLLMLMLGLVLARVLVLVPMSQLQQRFLW